MEESRNVVLTLKNEYKTISVELPWDANIEDLLEAFYGGMVGLTFHPAGIVRFMREWCDEKAESLGLSENSE